MKHEQYNPNVGERARDIGAALTVVGVLGALLKEKTHPTFLKTGAVVFASGILLDKGIKKIKNKGK